MTRAPSLELVHLGKRYGPTVALDDVSISIAAGSVHALLGENGAGKSTMVKLLSGLISPDSGEIRVDGSPVRLRSARDAQRAGIVTAAQELALVPYLTVAQNLFMGREPRTRLRLVSNGRLASETRNVCAEYELDGLDPDAPVSSLTLGARQQLELLRLLSKQGKVLLLDEPTAALGAHEVAWFFAQITKARQEGATIVFVSHRMAEVRQLCDSITVLRNGRHVTSLPAAEATDNDLVRLMIGRDAERHARKGKTSTGAPLLEVDNLASPPALVDASFSVHEGEVVGIAALQGHGQFELFQTLFGARGRTAGAIRLWGKPSHIRAPHQAVRGEPAIALVPEDRKAGGVMLGRSGKANLVLPVLDLCSRFGWVNRKVERRLAQEAMATLAIKESALRDDVSSLSGGNQQKIAIGKWLKRGARLFLMYDPTRGVDIGTKQDIYDLMRSIAADRNAVVVYSTDIEELLTISDRILVMYRGRFVGEFDGATCGRTEVMATMLGAPDNSPSPGPDMVDREALA